MKKFYLVFFTILFFVPHLVIAQSPDQQVDSLLRDGLSSKKKSYRTIAVNSHSENGLKRVTTPQEDDFSHPGYRHGNISLRQRVKKERRLIDQQEYVAKENCRNSGKKLKQRKACIKKVNRLIKSKTARLEYDPELYFNKKY